MLRGINRQQIFVDDEDNRKFLSILRKCKEVCGFELYAYCLMGNHLHLLLKEGKEELGQVFKRIAGSYVYWFNAKYQRVGHLFQDRFRSEPVEGDDYFLTVLRYIHQNPVKAGLARDAEDYRLSSYHEYLGTPDLVDTQQAFSLMDRKSLIDFHREESQDSCLDIAPERNRVTDEEAERLMKRLANVESAEMIQTLLPEAKRQLMVRMREQGVSLRQMERLTGETMAVIRRLSEAAAPAQAEASIPAYQPTRTNSVDITIL